MGIDYGTKKVGVALSDEAGTMGFPHSVVANDGRLFAHIRSLIAKENVDAVVIGESRSLHGSANPVALPAKEFGKQLHEESGLPVHFESEVFTTQEAQRDFEGVWQKKTATIDASAAALILTSYLSRHGQH